MGTASRRFPTFGRPSQGGWRYQSCSSVSSTTYEGLCNDLVHWLSSRSREAQTNREQAESSREISVRGKNRRARSEKHVSFRGKRTHGSRTSTWKQDAWLRAKRGFKALKASARMGQTPSPRLNSFRMPSGSQKQKKSSRPRKTMPFRAYGMLLGVGYPNQQNDPASS